jgi:hypothetical protein
MEFWVCIEWHCLITWIGTFLVSCWQVFILDEILHMAHFMVSSKKIIHDNSGALLDPVKHYGTLCHVGAVFRLSDLVQPRTSFEI